MEEGGREACTCTYVHVYTLVKGTKFTQLDSQVTLHSAPDQDEFAPTDNPQN